MKTTLSGVGAVLVATAIVLTLDFPVTMTLIALGWVVIGVIAFFLYSSRKGVKNWRTIDTFVCTIFAVMGPLGLLVLQSNNPRL
jgi:uncharacterized membrane protein